MLQAYRWPGNVRELQNAIERAVVLSSGPRLTPADFPAEIRQAVPPLKVLSRMQGIDATLPLNEAIEAFKRARVLQALTQAGGNQAGRQIPWPAAVQSLQTDVRPAVTVNACCRHPPAAIHAGHASRRRA